LDRICKSLLENKVILETRGEAQILEQLVETLKIPPIRRLEILIGQ